MDIDTEQVKKEAVEIASILDSVRNSPLKNAHEFVELLEGENLLGEALGIDNLYTINYGANIRKRDKFCLAYLIKVFINFTPCKDDMEILLVAYKRIEWGGDYDDSAPENWEKYWEYAYGYNKWFKGKKRGDKANLGRTALRKIIDELSEILAEIKLKSADGKLGYIDKVLKDFDNIPEKLTFPIPEWLRDDEQAIKTGGNKTVGRFKLPNGGTIELFEGFESSIDAIERIAKIVATAAPIIVAVVILGRLDRQIYNHHSRENQKEAGFIVSTPSREDTIKDQKLKIEGETSEFKPLPPDNKTYDEE